MYINYINYFFVFINLFKLQKQHTHTTAPNCRASGIFYKCFSFVAIKAHIQGNISNPAGDFLYMVFDITNTQDIHIQILISWV